MKAFLLLALLAFLARPPADAQEVRFLYMKQSGYDLADIVARAEAFHRETGIRVSPVFVEYEDRYNLILESAGKPVPDFDLLLADLIWVADFAERGIIDPLPPPLEREVRAGIVPGIHSAFDYRGRLWALPFHIDFQMLYTNLDMAEQAGFSAPPRTLEEMVRMARAARWKGLVKYPIFDSWRQQEVLVCELTWLTGAFGGSLTGADGRIRCTAPAAVRALTFMTGLLEEGLVNPYSLQSDENFASEVFLSGDCLFTTNWVFLIRLLSRGEGRDVGCWSLSTLPVSAAVSAGGTATSSVCGFEGLAVASSSRAKEAAWRFAEYLASPDFQSRHLEFMPVWRQAWAREEVQRGDPFLETKRRQIAGLAYRPVHPRYRQISQILQHWIAQALRGQVSPREALEAAQAGIEAATGAAR